MPTFGGFSGKRRRPSYWGGPAVVAPGVPYYDWSFVFSNKYVRPVRAVYNLWEPPAEIATPVAGVSTNVDTFLFQSGIRRGTQVRWGPPNPTPAPTETFPIREFTFTQGVRPARRAIINAWGTPPLEVYPTREFTFTDSRRPGAPRMLTSWEVPKQVTAVVVQRRRAMVSFY